MVSKVSVATRPLGDTNSVGFLYLHCVLQSLFFVLDLKLGTLGYGMDQEQRLIKRECVCEREVLEKKSLSRAGMPLDSKSLLW